MRFPNKDSELKLSNEEVAKTSILLSDKSEEYKACKQELQKAIGLLELTHEKNKQLEQNYKSLQQQFYKSENLRLQFISTSAMYLKRWLFLAFQNRKTEVKVQQVSEISNFYRLKHTFSTLKRNVAWGQIERRLSLKRDLSLKLKSLDSLKLNNVISKYQKQRTLTAEAFHEFSLKRK